MPTSDDRARQLRLEPRDDDALDPALAQAARALRADAPVRDAWRDAVLQEIASAPLPRRRRRRVTRRLVGACAAALTCLAVGAAAGRALLVPRAVTAAPDADAVHFAIVAPGASHVSLVGDFNGWDARATPMQASGDGRTWLARVPLTPGRHVYAYVVDGDVVADPAAPRVAGDDFGAPSSVVLVGRPSA